MSKALLKLKVYRYSLYVASCKFRTVLVTSCRDNSNLHARVECYFNCHFKQANEFVKRKTYRIIHRNLHEVRGI